MKVSIFNDQSSLPLSLKLIEKQVKLLLKEEKVSCDEVAIYFVDHKKMVELHKKFFQDPSPTDSISFPIDPPHALKVGYHFLGEVFVSVDQAIDYAKVRKKDPYEETLLYLIHGLLHLLGYDDHEKTQRKLMRKKEKVYLTLLKEQATAPSKIRKKPLVILSRKQKQK